MTKKIKLPLILLLTLFTLGGALTGCSKKEDEVDSATTAKPVDPNTIDEDEITTVEAQKVGK